MKSNESFRKKQVKKLLLLYFDFKNLDASIDFQNENLEKLLRSYNQSKKKLLYFSKKLLHDFVEDAKKNKKTFSKWDFEIGLSILNFCSSEFSPLWGIGQRASSSRPEHQSGLFTAKGGKHC